MKQEKICDLLHTIGTNIVIYLSLLMMLIIALMTFLFQARVSMKASSMETVTFHRNNIVVYIGLLLLLLLLVTTRKKIEKINELKLYGALAIVYFLLGIFFICGLGSDLRADARLINEAANLFSKGNYEMLEKGGYISRYPHQLGMVTYERVLNVFSSNIKIIFFMNLFFVLLNNWTLWKISRLLFCDSTLTHNLTIIFSFLFMPQFFFIAFAYGTIPGLTMLLLAFYFLLLFLEKRKNVYLLFITVCASFSCMFKSNYLIGVITILLVFMLDGLKKKRIIFFVYAIVLFLLVNFSGKALNTWYENQSGESLTYSEPKILWVAMGLRDENNKLGGWYDGFNVNTFRETNYNKEESKRIAKDSIQESLKRYIDSPKYAFSFFGEKVASTWCDPLFQSIWSGPLKDCKQSLDNEKMNKLYEESNIHKAIRDICEVFLIFTYILVTIFLIYRLKYKEYDICLFGIIFFLGGVIFHVLWETKSQYVYPYVFILIPYAVNAFEQIQWSMINKKQKQKKQSILGIK